MKINRTKVLLPSVPEVWPLHSQAFAVPGQRPMTNSFFCDLTLHSDVEMVEVQDTSPTSRSYLKKHAQSIKHLHESLQGLARIQ